MKAILRGHPFAGNKVLGTLETKNGDAVLSGMADVLRADLESGVRISRRLYTLSDGDDFIRAAAQYINRIEIVEE
jgi:hypothetical protein